MNIQKLEQYCQSHSDCQALVITDPANIGYLTQIFFPFPERKKQFRVALVCNCEQQVLVTPAIWEQTAVEQGWDGKIIVYNFNDAAPEIAYCLAVKSAVTLLGLTGTCGTDIKSLPIRLYDGILSKCSLDFTDIRDGIMNQRMIKSDDEVAKLKEAAIFADRGLIGSLNHAEGTLETTGYTLSEVLERVRVHAAEFKSYGIGEMNISEGKESRSYYTPITDFRKLEPQKVVRIDFTNACLGYWVPCSRMLYAGTPTPTEEADFARNYALKSYGASLLKAGKGIAALCNEICAYAAKHEIELVPEFGFGAGCGVQAVEQPILSRNSDLTLQAGMVIALDIYTRAETRELIHSVDIYKITDEGAEKISDFKDWNEYYTLDGCRNTH